MVVYTLEQHWKILRQIDLEKIPILAKIIFSDEAPFYHGRFVNKQNCRIGAQKTHTHTLKSRRTQNKSLFGADFCPKS